MSFSGPGLQAQPESLRYLGLPSNKGKNTSSRAGCMDWFGDCGGGGWIFCLLACLLFVCLRHDLNMDCIGPERSRPWIQRDLPASVHPSSVIKRMQPQPHTRHLSGSGFQLHVLVAA